jgi:hypothetical protein
MFPQQFNIRVVPATERASERILAVMETHDVAAGPAIEGLRQIEAGDALALAFERGGLVGDRAAAAPGGGRARGGTGRPAWPPTRWWRRPRGRPTARVLAGWPRGRPRWSLRDRLSLSVSAPCAAACDYQSPAAAAQIVIAHDGPVQVAVWLPEEPEAVLVAPPHEPAAARPLDFRVGARDAELRARRRW